VGTVEREITALSGASPLLVRVRKVRADAKRQPFVLDVALDVPAGITILFGPSGAGKSTLLDCIAGLVRPDSGSVSIAHEVWFRSDWGINLAVHRRRVGYVFQAPALFPHLTVEENVAYGIADVAARDRSRRVDEILTAFKISGLRGRRPSEISGGEAQRVELARALVTEPRVLLLDEPMSGLDEELKAHIMEDLRAWRAARDIPILYVTHSRAEAQALGDRMVRMQSGTALPEEKG
jgi:molybdate transport system ATP-binding protein